MKKALLFICFIFLISFAKAQIDAGLAAQLQNLLNSKIPANHGVSAHLIMPNGQTWSGTAGVNHQNVAITDSTVFHGASTTKLNIALLMLMLAQDGLLNLDDTWHTFLPNLNVAFNQSITVRQLLNHTSGIKDYLETAVTPTNVTSNFNYSYTPQYILENIVNPTPDFAPGTNFKYSSSNYVLAALIVEAVTGHGIEVELRNRIWNPLGMTHTYFGVCETHTEPDAGVWWTFNTGLTNYSNQPKTSMLSYGYGGANIISCPQDLAKLLYALSNYQLLNAQHMTQMLTFVPQSYSSWTKGYGLGIHHNPQAGDTLLGHDGYYTNLTDMFYSKKYGFTLVTMTNTETTWFGIYNPMYTIIANYFKSVGIKEHENKMQVSIYPNPTTGKFTIKSHLTINEIIVSDMLGRVIYNSSPDDTNVLLALEEAGVYVIKIRSGKTISTKKLVVK